MLYLLAVIVAFVMLAIGLPLFFTSFLVGDFSWKQLVAGLVLTPIGAAMLNAFLVGRR